MFKVKKVMVQEELGLHSCFSLVLISIVFVHVDKKAF